MAGARSDAERFEHLFEAHQRMIYAYFLRRTDPDVARDCTADTFLTAWRRMERVPDEPRTLPWLYAVARRVLANQRRSTRRRGNLTQKLISRRFGPMQQPGPEAALVQAEQVGEITAAMGRLKDADRELLRLALWEELPHETIGSVLGCSAHAVDQRLHRAVRRVERELDAIGHRHIDTTRGATPDTAPEGDTA